ncbi:MAG: helix-turn-helix domain-containing protein [Aristaeellaceae bacterium]
MQPKLQHVAQECLVFFYSRLSAPSHLHASFELLLPRQGQVRVRLDGEQRVVEPGELLVIFPGIVHRYEPQQAGDGVMLIFSERLLASMQEDWMTLRPVHPIVHLDSLDRDVAYCLERLTDFARGIPMNAVLAQSYLSLMFLRLLPALEPERSIHAGSQDLLYQAMQYMSQNLSEPLTLRMTAHALGVNSYYLSHLFSERLHMGFHTYLNALRIDQARRYLRVTNRPIEDIAEACGFANLRTFDRVFAEKCGCTPRDFRKAAMELRLARDQLQGNAPASKGSRGDAPCGVQG